MSVTVLYLGGGALFSEHSGRLLCGFNVAIKGLKTLSGGPRVCCLLPNGTIWKFVTFTICDTARVLSDLGRERQSVDGVLWSSAVGDAEVHDELTDAVLVGQWTSADVDVVQARIVEDQSDVVTSVDQSSTRLQ